MEIRYSHSPSFEEGWAIGLRLDAEIIPGSLSAEISSGTIVSLSLPVDAHVGLSALPELVAFSSDDTPLTPDDISQVELAMKSVLLQPAPFPWMTLDGAREALLVDTHGTLLCAEWNGHPQEWKELAEFQNAMDSLRQRYPAARSG